MKVVAPVTVKVSVPAMVAVCAAGRLKLNDDADTAPSLFKFNVTMPLSARAPRLSTVPASVTVPAKMVVLLPARL